MKKFTFLVAIIATTFFFTTARAQVANFNDQLKLIVALGEGDQYKSIQGKLVSTGNNGSLTYTFPLPLEGFETSMMENKNGRFVVAVNSNQEVAKGNIIMLMDETMRTIANMPGYVNSDFKAANPNGLDTFESVTELSKENSKVKIRIYKLKSNGEYFIFILPF
jgi:hypothetical protein